MLKLITAPATGVFNLQYTVEDGNRARALVSLDEMRFCLGLALPPSFPCFIPIRNKALLAADKKKEFYHIFQFSDFIICLLLLISVLDRFAAISSLICVCFFLF